jgi:hypothetical protein
MSRFLWETVEAALQLCIGAALIYMCGYALYLRGWL